MKKDFIGLHFGKFVLYVKNAREVYGHDDTWPFNADFDVYLENKPFLSGCAWNDGWGGPNELGFERNAETNQKLSELNDACRVFDYFDEKYKFNITHEFADIVEIMASLFLTEKNRGHVFSQDALIRFFKNC